MQYTFCPEIPRPKCSKGPIEVLIVWGVMGEPPFERQERFANAADILYYVTEAADWLITYTTDDCRVAGHWSNAGGDKFVVSAEKRH